MSLVAELSDKRLRYRVAHRKNIMDRFSDVQGSQRTIDRKYFSQLWESYTWAAIIGFINNKRVPLGTGGIDNAFKFSVIYNNGGELADALILLALAESDKGYKSLIDPDEIIRVIEEYANGGFEIIQSKLREDDSYFNNPDAFIEELLEREEIEI
ncbi:hypothetical protein [Salegentibacter maritimus]|uniref:hypothetical protein n=1 Tax=Salegentibacter maritimus TaxID=2794347 RepID=UPI0018E40FEF|nr:hypothetical protein [Salegentibacter maritimus]MBI6115992.1 hypothetical protein [Salegentibacter maritimus]